MQVTRMKKVQVVPKYNTNDLGKHFDQRLTQAEVGHLLSIHVRGDILFLNSVRELQPDGSTKKLTKSEIARRLGCHRNLLYFYLRGGYCRDLRIRALLHSWVELIKANNQE